MMRRESGVGTVVGALFLVGAVALVGCARPPATLEEPARTTVESDSGTATLSNEEAAEGSLLLPPEAAGVEALGIRELKVISDNGQQGVFAKLTGPPRSVSHHTLANPNRLVIELEGGGVGPVTAEQYPVDNPVVRNIRIGSHEGRMRITIELAAGEFPSYTVNDLNDTLVAFLGEPRGTKEPVHEQIVFTQRAVPEAPRRAAPPAAEVVASTDGQRSQPPADPRFEPAPMADPAPAVAGGGAHKLYYGQPISLDLKDADVHNVLRLLAEVSKLNIVATDDVKGKVTLRLFDVPWDQAFDIVLYVMSLESIQEGNVIRVSTVKRLRQEREELKKANEARRTIEDLKVEYLRLNYAKASQLAPLINGSQKIGGGTRRGGGQQGAVREEGVLSARGTVMVDEFTNTLIIRDIQDGIDNARKLVRRLDVQIPQVLIESNIVEATTNFTRELGVQWGYNANIGPQTGTSTGFNFPGSIGLGGSGVGVGTGGVPFIADFGAPNVNPDVGGSALDLSLGSLDGAHSLDLRLSAMEEQGKGRIISRPRVVTLNNVAATIKSLTVIRVRLPSTGTVINTGAGGAAGTSQTATEKIETGITLVVTPQVSSDGFVLLDMFVKSSQADFARTVDNIPTEITREATSHLLVRDGQTVVLGGIYRDESTDSRRGVPFFAEMPGLGWMFRSNSRLNRREDLLVFLTPRILQSAATTTGLPTGAQLWEQRNGDGAS